MSQDRARRLVDLYLEASSLGDEERDALVARVHDEDADLASDLEDLLRSRTTGSVSERTHQRYGSEVDPGVTLEYPAG